jgi:WD40 repeat protein
MRITGMLMVAAASIMALLAQADVTLEKARRKETLEGDLKGAIALYAKAMSEAKGDRALSAKALIRMAECHQRLGDAEARVIYERVLREYDDQKDAVTIARARLGTIARVEAVRGDRPVWTGPEVDIFGRISPDGRYLTYVDWYQTGNLMIHDMFKNTDHALTKNKSWDEGSGQASYSSISRDGKHVAYEWFTNEKNRNELLIARLDGTSIGAPRVLIGNPEIKSARPFEWSPDNKWIAVHITRPDNTTQIGLVGVDTGALKIFRSIDWRGPSNMAFSPDGKFIAYDLPESDTASNHDIFATAANGSATTTLVANPADDLLVGFSPAGRLMFASDRSRSMALWSQEFAGGRTQGAPVNIKSDFGYPWIHGLTSTGALYVTKGVSDWDVHFAGIDLESGKLRGTPVAAQRFPSRGRPDWSADGKQLLYVDCSNFGGGPCVMTVRNMETGQTREVRPALHYMGFPRWSPDGRSMLTSGRDLKGRRGLFLIDAATADTKLVVPGSFAPWGWAPGGKRFFYGLKREVREWDLEAAKQREVMSVQTDSFSVTISPDGKYVAYMNQESTLSVAPLDGGPPRELLRVERPEHLVNNVVLSWVRDSTALVVTKRLTAQPDHLGGPRELWLVPLSGAARKLDVDVSNWDVLNPIGARFSPDGTQVAFMAGKRAMEVWALESFLNPTVGSR